MNRRYFVRLLAASGVSFTATTALAKQQALADEASSLSVAQVHAMLKSSHGHLNFAGKRLFDLNLDNLDLHGANFDHANLLETSLRGANLSGASFVEAYLSATKFMNANLSGARMTGATFLSTAEGANFHGADLSHTTGYLIAPQGNFVHANLSHAVLRPDLSNQPMGLLHTILSQADLTGANLRGADLSFSKLDSAKLIGADLRGASFEQADLGRADFTGADVTGANFAMADLAGAVFVHVRGRSAMRGLESAHNRDQATFE